jgi:hypothetical protein
VTDCACGCGEKVPDSRQNRRYVSNAHRMRARRAKDAANDAIDRAPRRGRPADSPAPSNGSMGRTRAGLEVWLARQETLELPELLVEAARSLADEVDREPEASPLWGRYLDAVRQLSEPAAVATAWNEDMRGLHEKVAIGRADEEWRAAKYWEAIERGDPLAESWERVVPIGCARGDHSWRRRDYWGIVRCRHCDTEQVEP